MAEIKEFKKPVFLENQDIETIHKEMLDVVQKNIIDMDITEGSVAYDFTRPTAKEVARMVGFTLTEAIKNMYPSWAYGFNLDNLAYLRGMERKPAVCATGIIRVTGKIGTIIPDGFEFCTEATLDTVSITFLADGTHSIEGDAQENSIDIPVLAKKAGKIGNVAAQKIVLLAKPLQVVSAVTNIEPTTGGVDQESDNALRQRLVDYDQQQGVSYVGSITDYTRWAMEVTGIGAVRVLPADDGSGEVTLVLTDSNGDPASKELCQSVYDHIMNPLNPSSRIAPVNSRLRVVPPQTLKIVISAKITLENNVGIQNVKEELLLALKAYYKEAMVNGVVRYNEISGILIDVYGVADFVDLRINNGTVNIKIGNEIMPITFIKNIDGVIM